MSTTDPGPGALQLLERKLEIDPAWLVRGERDLLWWGGGLAQQIQASPPLDRGYGPIVTLSIRTDLLKGFGANDENLHELAVSGEELALAALVHGSSGERRIQLASCLALRPEAGDELLRLAATAASLQAAAAHRIVAELALLVGAEVDLSARADGEVRRDSAELLDLEEAVIRPLGDQPSRLDSEAIAAIAEKTMGKGAGIKIEVTEGVAIAKLDYADEPPALIVAEAQNLHPYLGSGVNVWLILPASGTPEPGAEICLALNSAEAFGTTGMHLWGRWTEHRGQLAHQIFLPNLLVGPETLQEALISQVQRCGWVELFLASAFE